MRDNCDEFIYYEDLERQEQNEQQLATNLNSYLPPSLNEKQREVFSLLVEACNALRRENHEVLYASMIKDTMKRKKPSFDESYYGYRSFTHLLEDADDLALVDIERNPKSGTYVVTRICGEGEDRAPGTSSRAEPGYRINAAQCPTGQRRIEPPPMSGRDGKRLRRLAPATPPAALSFIFPRRDPIINCTKRSSKAAARFHPLSPAASSSCGEQWRWLHIELADSSF